MNGRPLKFLLDSGQLKDAVCRTGFADSHGNADFAPSDRAEPYHVTSLALADKMTPVIPKDVPYLVVKIGSHRSGGLGLFLSLTERQRHVAGGKGKTVQFGHFRRNLPRALNQGFVGIRLGDKPNPLALCDIPAVLTGNDDFKGAWSWHPEHAHTQERPHHHHLQKSLETIIPPFLGDRFESSRLGSGNNRVARGFHHRLRHAWSMAHKFSGVKS